MIPTVRQDDPIPPFEVSVMRNLIFLPDGHLRYDWEHQGAILL